MTTNKVPNKIKYLFFIIIIAIIALGANYIWKQHTKTSENTLRLYGNVDIREVQLAFRQPGRIKQMLFDEGDTVTRGVPLATLDDQPYQDQLKSAKAAVQVAQANLAKLRSGLRPQEIAQAQEAVNQAQAIAINAEKEYQRQSSLLSSGATSHRTVDAAKAAYDQATAGVASATAALSLATEGFRAEDIAVAQANLAAAKAAYAQAVTALDDTKLVTPNEGTIISRVREAGSMVTSQNTVYSLSLDKPVYVRAYISEPDLGRIAPGTPVRVTSDSSDKIFHGQVGFISPRAEFTPKTVETTDLRTDLVYRLRIIINSNDDKELRQGMPVTIDVDNNNNNSDIGIN